MQGHAIPGDIYISSESVGISGRPIRFARRSACNGDLMSPWKRPPCRENDRVPVDGFGASSRRRERMRSRLVVYGTSLGHGAFIIVGRLYYVRAIADNTPRRNVWLEFPLLNVSHHGDTWCANFAYDDVLANIVRSHKRCTEILILCDLLKRDHFSIW